MIEGIYLSRWQGRQALRNGVTVLEPAADLAQLRERAPQVQFVFVKATQGATAIDPLYEAHRRMVEAAGYPCGVFHYFTNGADPRAQARHFFNLAGGQSHGLTILPSDDVEDPGNIPADLADKVYAFQQETAALWGVQSITYTRKTYWDPHVRRNARSPDPRFAGRLWWIAHYTTAINNPWLPVDAPAHAIHQYAEQPAGSLPGIPTRVCRERLNPRLTVADISFPRAVPVLELAGLRANLNAMLDDLGTHGRVGPYARL
jgi:lysozyme